MAMDGLSDSSFEVAHELNLVGQEGEELWEDDYESDDEDYFASLYSKEAMQTEAKLATESKKFWATIDDEELALSTDAPF